MKQIRLLLFMYVVLIATALSAQTHWQARTDTIWPARHYRELNGVATGDQMQKAWIDWNHDEGTVLVYGVHFPTGHVRADAVFKAKSGQHVTFGVRIVHPATETVVLEHTATSDVTTTAEQTMEIIPDTEMPYDGWYRLELTCPDGRRTLDRLNVMTFQRTSRLSITDSEIFMAPSVHLWWGTDVAGHPDGQAYDWTYLEALYPSSYRQPATYQMVIGTDGMYSGIQMPTHDDGSYGHSVLFSVWDNGDVEQDRNLPDYMRSAAVDLGPGAYATRFGGEGTGSSIRYDEDNLWEFDRWIQFLYNVRPDNTVVTVANEDGTTTTKEYESTLQSVWYKMADEPAWRYIGTLRMAGANRLTSGIYSFLENFGNRGGNLMRRCYYRNGAMRSAATGQWYALNKAGFGNTQNNGQRHSRYDFGHGVSDVSDNTFYLETGGYMGTRDSADRYEPPTDMPWVDTIDVDRLSRCVDLAMTHAKATDIASLIEATRTVSDPVTWRLINYSDEETVGEGDYGRAAQILDGNTVTYYHNKWKNGSAAFPHTFTFDAGAETTVSSIGLYQGRDRSYRASQLTVSCSDDGSSWSTVASRISIEDSEHPTIELPQPVTARYFRLRFTAGYGPNLVINELYFKHEYRLDDLLTLAQRLIAESDHFGGYAPADIDAYLRTVYADGTCTDADALRQAIMHLGQTAMPLTFGVVGRAEHLTPLDVYQLHNADGRGDLIALADGKPAIAGAVVSGALDAYRVPTSVTDPLCNWLLLFSESYNEYYLYNLGAQKYLSVGATTEEVRLSDVPTALQLKATGGGFAFVAGGKYLGLNSTAEQPFTLGRGASAASIFQLRRNYSLKADPAAIAALADEGSHALHEGNNVEYLFQQGTQTYAKAFVAVPQTTSRLVRSAASLTANCNTTQQEVHNLAKLIDRNTNTYYESWYSGIEWPQEMPYIQAKFTSGIQAFSFEFTPSQHEEWGQTDIPADIIVSASPGTRNFLPVARITEGLPATVSESFTSPVLFTDGDTRSLRFQVMKTLGRRAESRVFAMSEFQIHSVEIDEQLSPYYTNTVVREAFDALLQQLQATRQHIDDGTADATTANELKLAIERAEQALLTDGIGEVENVQVKTESVGAVYDLSGRVIARGKALSGQAVGGQLSRGVYILRSGRQTRMVVR